MSVAGSGVGLPAGRLTANATSYSDTIARTIVYSQWTYEDSYDLIYRVPVMGKSPYYVRPTDFKLDGTVTNPYQYSTMRYDVKVYDNSNSLVWESGLYNEWGVTLHASTLNSALYSDADIAYRVQFRIYRTVDATIDNTHIGDVHVSIDCDYDDTEEPPETSPAPFELPDDWVQNTTNTIADKFVPFETVTTPIDSDSVDDSVDKFKEFLEGVQERETLATVFMGYVSELLRLKGITAFICFAICCCTMIAIFELSGG